jgi:hypothetical protein
VTANPTVYVNGFARSGIDRDMQRRTPVSGRIITDRATQIEVLTANGKRSALPAYWLWNGISEGVVYRDAYTKLVIALDKLTDVELVQIDTNFISGHTITVSADAWLRLWDGRAMRAGDVRGREQLLGQYGMYVVTQRRKLIAPVAFRGNFSSVGGIYVGLDADRAAAAD